MHKDIHLAFLQSDKQYALLKYFDEHNPSVIISFGLKPQQIGLNLDHQLYKLLRLKNIKLIFAHSLSDLEHNKRLKKSLWEVLKLLRI